MPPTEQNDHNVIEIEERYTHDCKRAIVLVNAIKKTLEAQQEVPEEWMCELNDLVEL